MFTPFDLYIASKFRCIDKNFNFSASKKCFHIFLLNIFTTTMYNNLSPYEKGRLLGTELLYESVCLSVCMSHFFEILLLIRLTDILIKYKIFKITGFFLEYFFVFNFLSSLFLNKQIIVFSLRNVW